MLEKQSHVTFANMHVEIILLLDSIYLIVVKGTVLKNTTYMRFSNYCVYHDTDVTTNYAL